jgi:hypothetical protein
MAQEKGTWVLYMMKSDKGFLQESPRNVPGRCTCMYMQY